MIFGNGSVANVELKNTKGHHAGVAEHRHGLRLRRHVPGAYVR